jgi:hypothetical protein
MKEIALIAVAALVVALALYVFASLPLPSRGADNATNSTGADTIFPTPPSMKSALVGNKTLVDEITRLTLAYVQRALGAEELKNLKSLLSSDKSAAHEFEELEVLIRYNETVHALHAWAFLADYVSTGKELLCPGHQLAHYYLFTRYNETELAEHALEEAKEQLPEWIPKARVYNEMYPTVRDFNETIRLATLHIASIESGNTTATDYEISLLAHTAICV